MDIHLTYRFSHHRDVVFEAWLSEEYLVAPVIKIDVDPVEGGVFRLTSQTSQGTAVMEGKILEIVQNRRVKYTWHWGGQTPPSVVDVNFAADGATTEVEISHTGLESDAAASSYKAGWGQYVSGLKAILKEAP